MKKIRLAGLTLLAPIALLAGCGSSMSALSLNANWHTRTDTTAVSEQLHEELVYGVEFTPDDENSAFQISYGNASYKMVLKGVPPATSGYEQGNVYHLHSEFKADVTFTLNGETLTFDRADTVLSDVYFLGTLDNLRPLRSTVTSYSHTPPASAVVPDSLEEGNAFYLYHETISTVYNAEFTQAVITTRSHLPENEGDEPLKDETGAPLKGPGGEDVYTNSESVVKLKNTGTTFDNEQLYFALRAVNLSSAFSFRTVYVMTKSLETLSVASAPEQLKDYKQTFSVNGQTEERTLNAYRLTLGRTVTPKGQSQTLTYAATTDPANNVYRNVMLRAELPRTYGKMIYSLKEAKFISE